MREIKFRVCTIDRMFYIVNGGEYQLIFGIGGLDWSLWDEEGEICNSNEPGTAIMQYTGIKDKNNKEIYEGDVLKDNSGHGVVKWIQEHSAFLVYVSEPAGYHYIESDGQLKNSEVMGNIYENHELISE